MCEYGDEFCDCDEPVEPNDALAQAAKRARELVQQTRGCQCQAEEPEEEDEEEEDDGEPSRSEAFDVMTPTQFNAHRLDAWQMAHAELTKHNWGDDYHIDPSDVLILARFIEGDDLGD